MFPCLEDAMKFFIHMHKYKRDTHRVITNSGVYLAQRIKIQRNNAHTALWYTTVCELSSHSLLCSG